MAASSTNANPILTIGRLDPRLLALALQSQELGESAQATSQAGEGSRNAAALGLNLLAKGLIDHKRAGINAQLSQAQLAYNQSLAAQLRPGNPAFARLMSADPQGAMSELEKAELAPVDTRQGNTLVNAPSSVAGTQGSAPGTFTAPVMQDDGGIFGNQTMAGYTSTGQRPMNYTEQVAQQNASTQAAAQQETTAQNQRSNAIAQQQVAVARQQAAASQAQAVASGVSASASAQNAGVVAGSTPTFAVPQGYFLNGAQR